MSGSAVVDTERPEQTEPTIEVPAPRRIDIVGYTESRKEAHWGNPDWEKWVCNDLIRFVPNDWHRIYDVHAVKDIKADAAHDAFLCGGSRTLEDGSGNTVTLDGRPVYVMKTDPSWPTAVEFPKDEINDAFGTYFTNSIAWMVAHAMLEIREAAKVYAAANLEAVADFAKDKGEGATELLQQASIGLYDALIRDYEGTCAIHVYGVDMATAGEYGAQRPSCEHVLGIAQGRGIETYVPMSSDLLKVTAQYGAEDDSALFAKFTERKNELTKRYQHLSATRDQCNTQMAQIEGALETTNYVINVWCNPRGHRDAESTEDLLPEAA